MLDFNFESPSRDSLAEANKTPRAAVDRRAAKGGSQGAATTQRRRRRHDGLYSGKPLALLW